MTEAEAKALEEKRRQEIVAYIMKGKHPEDPLTAVQVRFMVDIAAQAGLEVQKMIMNKSTLVEPEHRAVLAMLCMKEIEAVCVNGMEILAARADKKLADDASFIDVLRDVLGIDVDVVAQGDGFVVLGSK